MIPKNIHYYWFGGNPLPPLAEKCIESWKKYLLDYEMKEWNEDNFDVNMIPYTKEAYECKKFAFVSDYTRFLVLYYYGGLYFDTDVEVINKMDNITRIGSFMAYEHDSDVKMNKLGDVAPGLGLGVNEGNPLYKSILDEYKQLHYIGLGGKISSDTVVTIVTKKLKSLDLKPANGIQKIDNIYIYPKEYLCPKDYNTGKLQITNRTVAIHHYGVSWLPWYAKFEM